MKKIAILIILVCLLCGCSSETADVAPASQPQGTAQTQAPTAPSVAEATKPTLQLSNFTVQDAYGKWEELYTFAGDPIVLHFWAVEDSTTKEVLPLFERASIRNTNVHFLMIHATDGVQETTQKAQDFIYHYGYTFPVFYDIEGEALSACNIETAPTTIFIDMFGKVVQTTTGPMTARELENALELIR
jgi:thiol-disulfide isomerase/thioredoxin